MVAVLALSLQQDFEVPEQQDFPLAHFLCLPLPVSAKVTPETSKAAVINKNTFFIIMIFVVINRGKSNRETPECQVSPVNYEEWQ
ncbi:MAG TPA: hypothetical protein VGO09_04490 [Flavisolibacter sp.]|nr:hypothetical protein [Flavisolibacter sp.]